MEFLHTNYLMFPIFQSKLEYNILRKVLDFLPLQDARDLLQVYEFLFSKHELEQINKDFFTTEPVYLEHTVQNKLYGTL